MEWKGMTIRRGIAMMLIGLMISCAAQAVAEESAPPEAKAGTRTHITIDNVESYDNRDGISRHTRFGTQVSLECDITIPAARDAIDARASLRLMDKKLDAGVNLTPRDAQFTLSGVSSMVSMRNGYLREGLEALGLPSGALPKAIAPERLLAFADMDAAEVARALLDHFSIVYGPALSDKVRPWWIDRPIMLEDRDADMTQINIPPGDALSIVNALIEQINGDAALNRVLNAVLWFVPLPAEGSFVSAVRWPDGYTFSEQALLSITSREGVTEEVMLSATVHDQQSDMNMMIHASVYAREDRGGVNIIISPLDWPISERYPALGDFNCNWESTAETAEAQDSTTTASIQFRNGEGEAYNLSLMHTVDGVYRETPPLTDIMAPERPEETAEEADWIAVKDELSEALYAAISREPPGEGPDTLDLVYHGKLTHDPDSGSYRREGGFSVSEIGDGDGMKAWTYDAEVTMLTAPYNGEEPGPLLSVTDVHADREGARALGEQCRATWAALLRAARDIGFITQSAK